MIILLAYFHRYGWIAAMLLMMYLTKSTDVVLGVSAITFAVWTLLGYLLKWKHLYCSYQNAYHMPMTPDRIDWDTVRVTDALGIPAFFLILGAIMLAV